MSILVGFDGSPESHRAVREAAEEAQRRGGAVHVLRYLEHEAGESPTQVRRDADAARDAAEGLAALEAALTEQGIDVTTELIHGLADGVAAALVGAAEGRDVDLIVLGFRPRAPVEGFVVGSVGREVVRRAPCPVLTVKADTDD